jgi:hypothetical protein
VRRSARDPFWWIVFISLALKLWLTSNITINPIYGPHDNSNFITHALWILRGKWFGPYDDLTLIKGPGFPLYLALIARLGLPLPLAHQLLIAGAAFLAGIAIRPAVRNSVLLGCVFVVLIFDPTTFSALSWGTNRSQVIDSFALLAIASCVGTVIRARARLRVVVPWMTSTGVFAALVGVTREDTIWIAAPIAFFLGSYFWYVRRTPDRRVLRAYLPIVPAIAFAAIIATLMTINGRVYGWFTTVEMTSPAFTSAYQSLSRIVVTGVDNRVYPFPTTAREIAYAVSPAAAELKQWFDPGHGWRRLSCTASSLCDDVSSGFLVFTLRDAVSGAGYYTNGAKARAYYLRLSSELDAACATGKMTCRPKSLSLAPNIRPSDLLALVRYSFESLGHTLTYDQTALGAMGPLDLTHDAIRQQYEEVVGSGVGRAYSYRGWLLHPRGSAITYDADENATSDDITFEDSGDLRDAFAHSTQFSSDDLAKSRFELTTSCPANCHIVVRQRGRPLVRIPLDPNVSSFTATGVAYHLDGTTIEPPEYIGNKIKPAIQAQLLAAYGSLVPIWFALVLLIIVFRAIRLIRGHRPQRAVQRYFVISGLVVALAAQCAILGLVSAVSFYALYPEYQITEFRILELCLGIVAAVEFELAFRFIRRKLPRRVDTDVSAPRRRTRAL